MIIGLYGPSRSGKDTVAGILVKNHSFEQRNLASPIRNILLPVFDVLCPEISLRAREQGWDDCKKVFPESVDAMIALGQGGRDFIEEDVWLNACVNKPFESLVIADVRQPNEYNYIWDNGGEVWWVVSDRENVQSRGMDGLLDDKYFPVRINNNGTIEELEEMIDTVVKARK